MRRILILLLVVFSLSALSGCTEIELLSHVTKTAAPPSKTQGTFKVGSPYRIGGHKYSPREQYDLVETGIASWYGPQFHGKRTANGETFDMNELTAAHRTLQMPSLVRVTNLENGRSLVVRVNDRGPYSRGRIIDLSKRSAELLGFKNKGTAKVRLQVLKQESLRVAQAAKSGRDTSGYEIAANRQRAGIAAPQRQPRPQPQQPQPQPQQVSSYQTASAQGGTASIQPVTRASLENQSQGGAAPAVQGHTRNGAFYPDAVVTQQPVMPSRIYVQVGSFGVQDNALRLRDRMQSFSTASVYPATVNGKPFYRVRLAAADVAQADALLTRLADSGYGHAIIVVD